jgi:hypothetical protein
MIQISVPISNRGRDLSLYHEIRTGPGVNPWYRRDFSECKIYFSYIQNSWYQVESQGHCKAEKKNSVASVCKRTIPTEWPPLVSEVSANFFADRACHVVSVTNPYGRILRFLERSRCYCKAGRIRSIEKSIWTIANQTEAFRLAANCLNQLRYRVPLYYYIV